MVNYAYTCLQCNTCFSSRHRNRKFCCRSCSAKFNNNAGKIGIGSTKIHVPCPGCDQVVIQGRQIFCSLKCRKQHQIQQWEKGLLVDSGWNRVPDPVRELLLKEAHHKCERCRWHEPHPLTGLPPLEIDHIDGDSTNHQRQNLRVLCPNCHALTPTFRRHNGSKGRRRKKERAT